MKYFLLSAFLSCTLFLSAQTEVVNSQSRASFSNGITYCLPKTTVVVEVQAVKTIQLVGPYYQYTERYLGTHGVIMKNSITWSVKNVKVITKAIPDDQNTYRIKPDLSSAASFVTLSPEGFLCGVNVPEPNTSNQSVSVENSSSETPDLEFNNLILTQDLLQANSIASMAEVAAKQIYHLRDSRMSLITGDVDKISDGAAVKVMLQKMDQSEKDLMELFIGKTVTIPTTVTFEITPAQEVKNEVLFRLSTEDGVVARDNLSGQPYYLSVNDVTNKNSAGTVDRSNDNGLYYRLPGQADVTLSDPSGNVIFRQSVTIAQFGSVKALPGNMFNKSTLKVSIDPATGALLYIQK
jgi:hypothetical protein